MAEGTRFDRDGRDPIARLEAVEVRLGGVPVLRGVDLELAAGEVLGLKGANGSGKSTLLRVLATLLPPSAGHGIVLGADVRHKARLGVRRHIALLGHATTLYPQLTLRENLAMVARLVGVPAARGDQALERVGLAGAGQRQAGHCSQGMLRRTELARVMLTGPRLLLLDEAHAGLDAAAAGLVDLVVAGVRNPGGAVVMVSHEPQRLRPLVDRTMELAEGRLWPVKEAQEALLP